MNIVFLVSSLSSGGAERVASTLCNAWAARGDVVTLIPTFSGGGAAFYPLDERVRLIYLANTVSGSGKTLLGYLRRLLSLRKLIRDSQPDVVVSFLPVVNAAAVIAMCGLRLPLIVCERTDPSVAPISKQLSFATKSLYRFSEALVVQTADVALKSAKLFPGVKKIITIANPVPDEILLLDNKNTGERKVLLSLGRLVQEKQVGLIVDVFLKIHNHFPEWDLHIYGDGPSKDELAKKIQASGLGARIFLKGTTTLPSQVMANADVFIMASKFEGFPNALLEAMAAGLPCVTFDCPSGPREITVNGEYALLVPAGDIDGVTASLTRLLSDEQLRHELGKKARHSIQLRYRLSTVLTQWDALFRGVRHTGEDEH